MSLKPALEPELEPKPRRKVTGRGVAVFGGAIILLLFGFTFGNGALMTMGGCAWLMMGICWVLAPMNLRGLELTIQLPPRFFAERSVLMLVELHNRRRLLNAREVDICMHFPYKVERSGHAAWTSAQGSSELREHLSIPGRAVCKQVKHELRSTFPLGLFEVSQTSSCGCEALVYPKPIKPPELQWEGLQPDFNPMAGLGLGELFGEPRGIRQYQPGDKATRIHQAASARSMARGQGLQVRSYDPPGLHPERCRIVFHSFVRKGEILRTDRFERGLSLAAGTLAHFHANQKKVSFQADFTAWDSSPCENRVQYMDCLSLLSKTKRARETKADELEEVLRQTPPEEQLIIISDAPSDEWANLIPSSHPQTILINIRDVRFKQRDLQLQPANHS